MIFVVLIHSFLIFPSPQVSHHLKRKPTFVAKRIVFIFMILTYRKLIFMRYSTECMANEYDSGTFGFGSPIQIEKQSIGLHYKWNLVKPFMVPNISGPKWSSQPHPHSSLNYLQDYNWLCDPTTFKVHWTHSHLGILRKLYFWQLKRSDYDFLWKLEG